MTGTDGQTLGLVTVHIWKNQAETTHQKRPKRLRAKTTQTKMTQAETTQTETTWAETTKGQNNSGPIPPPLPKKGKVLKFDLAIKI